jgi:AraC family transcriptional regulator of adaptative response / DNA-3-methyladenine glycosylase II
VSLPDFDTCYRAMASRDGRFVGRFFIGVKTTGIYCRPGCPARMPKRTNVRFFACAAAAEAAGLRPCLRCRPEAAPESAAWLGTSATVSRALRLISEGAVDEHGMEELALRLGMTGRHLRRLFSRHLGASPRDIAQSRRVHFARQLLDETDLPMVEVALAAGFSSVRRFNDAIRAVFQRTPSEIRRGRAAPSPSPGLTLRLPFRPPLDWTALLDFLRQRAIPGVEAIEGDVYRRSVGLGENAGEIEVFPAARESSLLLQIHLRAPADLLRITRRARRLFDLDADPAAIGKELGRDPLLRRSLARRPGLRVPGCWDRFELLVRAILGQQVSVKGATTLSGRIVHAFGERRRGARAPDLTHTFPTPAALAEADLRQVGLPEQRAAAIRSLARAVRDGVLDLDGLTGLEASIAALIELPGIGPWTAQYVAMRALGEPDAFPAGDLGIRKALCTDDEAEVLRRAEAWRPWRAYAAMHLWETLSLPR